MTGECPLSPNAAPKGDLVAYMGALVNWGAEHSMLHTNQAIRCWSKVDRLASKEKLDERVDAGKSSIGKNKNNNKYDQHRYQSMQQYREVARINMKVLREKKMFPYSKG